jgi:hypothetical protein
VLPEQGIFAVAQLDGTVTFRSLKDGSHICCVNDPNWSLTVKAI